MTGVLVHEWIAQAGGSENVLKAFADLYPDAPVVCLWNDSVGRFDPERIQESWLSHTPLRRSKAAALPLMPLAWRLLRDHEYEWALISSHAFAHHARFRGAGPAFRKLVYVHTPARYVWTPSIDARGNRVMARLASRTLKSLDRRRAREGAEFAANSAYVSERINQAWGVSTRVIFPPVEVERIQVEADWSTRLNEREAEILAGLPEDFVLGASRFIPYKELDRVIGVGEATGRPVVLAGSGPEKGALKGRARDSRVPVHFVDRPSDAMLYALYQRTSVYVFPAIEDFGIMPVEAMAAGAAVVARDVGGAAESTVHGETGALTSFVDPVEVREAVDLAISTDRSARLARAREFGTARFDREVRAWVDTS